MTCSSKAIGFVALFMFISIITLIVIYGPVVFDKVMAILDKLAQ